MARIKKKIITNVTLEQAQEACKTVAEKKNALEKIEAKMNEEVNRVKGKYVDQITELSEDLEEPVGILEVFANEQKSSWGKKKSFELLYGWVGFRTGMPKVSKDKKFTWDAVLELMKRNSLFKPLIRTKEEISKEAILALNPDKDKKVLESLKEQCYLFIDQDDNFFVEPKKEEVAAA